MQLFSFFFISKAFQKKKSNTNKKQNVEEKKKRKKKEKDTKIHKKGQSLKSFKSSFGVEGETRQDLQ